MFASADEGGNLCIFSSVNNGTGLPMKPRISWSAHKNAIFDVIWSLDDEHLVSASGDLNAAVWDIETQKLLCVFAGHSASVKCVSAHPQSKCTDFCFYSMIVFNCHKLNMQHPQEMGRSCSGILAARGK